MTSDTTGRTAIHRTRASAPARWLVNNTRICMGHTGFRVLDYACGHGQDAITYKWDSYDPYIDSKQWYRYWVHHNPHMTWDYVVCTYLLNVLTEEDAEHELSLIRPMAKIDTYVTVRRSIPKEGTPTQRWVEMPDDELIYERPRQFAIYRLTR